ncbi:MAG: 50S ribosomal protein L9 [Chloroflexota bacterium]
MKVILTQDIKTLGKKGSVVEVAEGHGRNYLIPRGMAIEASTGNMRTLKTEKEADAARSQRELKEAQKLGERIRGVAITIRARTGEGGRLFGSVTNKDIAAALATVAGVRVDRRKVEAVDIKTTGTYRVTIKLHPEVSATVDVTVVPGE